MLGQVYNKTFSFSFLFGAGERVEVSDNVALFPRMKYQVSRFIPTKFIQPGALQN